MKLKTTLAGLLSLVAMATSHAFMINFGTGNVVPSGTNVGTNISISDGNDLVVNVVGYGDVTFSYIGTNPSGSVQSGTQYAGQFGEPPASTLEFDFGDVVKVTFAGSTDFSNGPFFDIAGADTDSIERTDVSNASDGSVWNLTYAGDVETGAGLVSATWDVVPEPSSAALGAIGMSMILLRRRKA